MPREKQPARGKLTLVLDILKISESVVSSITIALTGMALATCALYGLALLFGGTESKLFVIFAFAAIAFMTPIMFKATTEEGLAELKSNALFNFSVLVATIVRDSFAAIFLFRLVLYANILFGDKGVSEGWPPLWEILKRAIIG